MRRILIALLLFAAMPLSAKSEPKVVYLNFSAFGLLHYSVIDGVPKNPDHVELIQQLIVANMVEDWAPFDVYFVTARPANGAYYEIMFVPDGDADILSQPLGSTLAQVRTGSFAFVFAPLFNGPEQTQSDRIANAASQLGSHELGALFGLEHCHSANDYFESGDCAAESLDVNEPLHIMTTETSALIAADGDRFFAPHSERRVLYSALQPRNHWAPLGDTTNDARCDLDYAAVGGADVVEWYHRESLGMEFDDPVERWSSDRGEAGQLFYIADVTGDGRGDLVRGKVIGTWTIEWWVALWDGTDWGPWTRWSSDTGNTGDLFRLADVTGEGKSDLLFGRPLDASTMQWMVKRSTGSAFDDPFQEFSEDAGDPDDIFLVGDVTGDGRADLVAVDRGNGTAVYSSDGNSFDFEERDSMSNFSFESVFLGDAEGDGKADLITVHVRNVDEVEWYVRTSNGCGASQCFTDRTQWASNFGNAGDLLRIGDGDGDGMMDIFAARPEGMDALLNAAVLTWVKWYGQLSGGTEWVLPRVWRIDAGNEGHIFP